LDFSGDPFFAAAPQPWGHIYRNSVILHFSFKRAVMRRSPQPGCIVSNVRNVGKGLDGCDLGLVDVIFWHILL
jgi:hypothetical protein